MQRGWEEKKRENGNGKIVKSKGGKKTAQENEEEDKNKGKAIPVDVQRGLASARGRGSRGGVMRTILNRDSTNEEREQENKDYDKDEDKEQEVPGTC